MATYYAWTNFETERNEYGQVTKVVTAGDTVSQSDLGSSDADWEELLTIGAIREEEYPDIPENVSPAEYLRQKVASGEASDEEVALAGEMMAESGTADTDAKRQGTNKAEEAPAATAAPAAKTGTTAKTDTASSST